MQRIQHRTTIVAISVGPWIEIVLLASRNSVYKQELEKHHDRAWKDSPRYRKFKRIDSSTATAASRAYWKLSRGLPRKLLSILTQLRTGHAPLQKHLNNIRKVNSPTCPCCKRHPETVYHYLMECPAHRAPRDRLRRNVGPRNFSYSSLLTTAETLPHLFWYVNDTGRFKYIVGDLPQWGDDDGQ